MAPDTSPSEVEQVDDLISSTRQSLSALEAQIEPLLRERDALQTRLEMLVQLRGSYETQPDTIPGSAKSKIARPTSTSGRVQSQVREILKEAGCPLHTREIYDEFLRRGWSVPGAGRPGNITAHLTHASGIASPQRGYWTLRPDAEE